MSRKIGAKFQDDIEKSCHEQNIFFHNIKDVYLPPDVRRRVRLPKNKYDALIYNKGVLFPVELKTTNKKSISFSESIIKQHQLEALESVADMEGIISGLLLNFREQPANYTFFVHIKDFMKYKYLAENQLEHTYKCREGKKLNKASIPLDICQEIGVELLSIKKKVNYRYFVQNLIDELIEKYNKGNEVT